MLTFEKAKELRDSGFKPPKYKLGQFYYSKSGLLYCIGTHSKNSELVAFCAEDTRWASVYEMAEFVYAPAASEIVESFSRSVDADFCLLQDRATGLWICRGKDRKQGSYIDFCSKDLDTACANAYILFSAFDSDASIII